MLLSGSVDRSVTMQVTVTPVPFPAFPCMVSFVCFYARENTGSNKKWGPEWKEGRCLCAGGEGVGEAQLTDPFYHPC